VRQFSSESELFMKMSSVFYLSFGSLIVGTCYGKVVGLSSSCRYQVVTTWMVDCSWTGKPSRYITNTKVNSAFHRSEVGRLSTSLSCLGYARVHSSMSGGR